MVLEGMPTPQEALEALVGALKEVSEALYATNETDTTTFRTLAQGTLALALMAAKALTESCAETYHAREMLLSLLASLTLAKGMEDVLASSRLVMTSIGCKDPMETLEHLHAKGIETLQGGSLAPKTGAS
jgi:hypothetical protein